MKILKEINGSRIRLECIGKLDAMSAPGFREAVSEIDFSQTEDAALDFENVPYVSSAGLRELLILKKSCGPGSRSALKTRRRRWWRSFRRPASRITL